MDALSFISDVISLRMVTNFLDYLEYKHSLDIIKKELMKVQTLMETKNFKEQPEEKEQAIVEVLRQTVRKVLNFMNEMGAIYIFNRLPLSSWDRDDFVKDWEEIVQLINSISVSIKYLVQPKLKDHEIDAITHYLIRDIKKDKIETLAPNLADYSESVEGIAAIEKSQAILLMKAFPGLNKLIEPDCNIPELKHFLLELSGELQDLPELICRACEGEPRTLLLIGSLLSSKPRSYEVWNKVKDDLIEIKGKDNDSWLLNVCTYCYDDLPNFLKPCFLYLASYPLYYEIPARSLIEKWVAEGFVIPENGETKEETAYKYLEQLVKRSLVCVSKRSFLGTIQSCRVPFFLSEFAIQQSNTEGFLIVNPDEESMGSAHCLAFHPDNKKEYTEVQCNTLRTFLAFNFDRNVLGNALLLRVLELRNSAIPVLSTIWNMTHLRYLCLRGSKISYLSDISNLENLETLDVRDTEIRTLPSELWTIMSLRHVYTSNIAHMGYGISDAKPNLQTLKTVRVDESLFGFRPTALINIRKLALFMWDYSERTYVANTLSHLANLLSLTIISDKLLPPEFADTRGFPNLKTVRSLKLDGKWYCRNLIIEYIDFPPNLTKLTLIKSDLREDPMPKLAKLKALKYLSLQDGAYNGKEMVCPENGFPQLQFLELSNLEKLAELVVKEDDMPQLSTLRVIRCPNLHIPSPLLDRVPDKVID